MSSYSEDHFSDFDFDQDYQKNNFLNPGTYKKTPVYKNSKLVKIEENIFSQQPKITFIEGDRVFHSKFGMGFITELYENKDVVNFDNSVHT